jgi:hypothetical protein
MTRILSILCCALSLSASGATYYVSIVSGSDGNNGTSTATSWAHCPGDPDATSVPAGKTLSGDTVIFKGGESYILSGGASGGIALMSGPSPSTPNIYDGNTAGTWGTGRANIQEDYTVLNPATGSVYVMNAFQGSSVALSNILIQGFDGGPVGGAITNVVDRGSAVPSVYGGFVATSAQFYNVTLNNDYVHNIGYFTNTKPMDLTSISGVGLSCLDGTNIVITNCEFTKVAVPVQLLGNAWLSNTTVCNSRFHDFIVWCIAYTTTTGCSRNNAFFYGNQFYNTSWQYSAAYWTGYSAPHCDILIDYAANGTVLYLDGTNIDFYNNLIWVTNQNSALSDVIRIGEGENINFYNNVCNFPPTGDGMLGLLTDYPGDIPNTYWRILNNSFLTDFSPPIGIFGFNQTGQFASGVNIDMENNVLVDTMGGSGANYLITVTSSSTNVASGFKFDYNCYLSYNTFISTVPNDTAGFFNGNVANTWGQFGLAGMQVLFGWETHGKFGNPLYVATNYINTINQQNNNLQLQSGSPAIGAGANLTSSGLPGITSDILGNARPTTGPWTMGAYNATTTIFTFTGSYTLGGTFTVQ